MVFVFLRLIYFTELKILNCVYFPENVMILFLSRATNLFFFFLYYWYVN